MSCLVSQQPEFTVLVAAHLVHHVLNAAAHGPARVGLVARLGHDGLVAAGAHEFL